jgi:hypothetical protein
MSKKYRPEPKPRSRKTPVYPKDPPSNGAFASEIAALRRIFFDYTQVYDRARTQSERDRAVQMMSLLSVRMGQLARAQHFITPPEDPQWTELIRAGKAILRDKPIMDLFRPKENQLHASAHPDHPRFPGLDHPPSPS